MKNKKIAAFLLVLIAVVSQCRVTALAAPYNGYNYSYSQKAVPAPNPYIAKKVIRGEDIGITPFNSPEDIDKDKKIYIADAGNNRIVCLDKDFKVERIIDKFNNDGFKNPCGVFVDEIGDIYVADTENKRIVQLNNAGEFIREIKEPKSDVIRKDFKYLPSKVALDKAKRIYVVCQGAFDGILQLDSDGNFIGFTGKNLVKFSAKDMFWKRVATKAQREKMSLFLPVEFSNLSIDENGFIYTTSTEIAGTETIKRLNPSGTDVLKRDGYYPPRGDIEYAKTGSKVGGSVLTDIAVHEYGVYSVLDTKRGRIFTYDRDGNLLYQFGQLGDQVGTFKTPSALDYYGENILVLDKGNNYITIFEPTEYANYIMKAIVSHYEGKTDEALENWSQVLKLNSNLEMAYVGMGKAFMKQDDNEKAMRYFKLGSNRKFYSRAFEKYRKEYTFNNFGKLAAGFLGLIFLIIVISNIRKRKKKTTIGYKDIGTVEMIFYVIKHPFKGFWELKYEKKGKLIVSMIILLLVTITFILKKQYTGFIVNFNDLKELNSIDEIKYVVLPFFLWCISNLLLTTLMDGEGTFKDIVIATGYALTPFILIYIPQILFSRVIIIEEISFYFFFEVVTYIWVIWLMFVSTMTVHQYTPSKTVATMALTVVGMGILIFLSLLMFNLIQQMFIFVMSIYQEIIYRL
jgi:DNA-binding beta-propeller fold protein YncE